MGGKINIVGQLSSQLIVISYCTCIYCMQHLFSAVELQIFGVQFALSFEIMTLKHFTTFLKPSVIDNNHYKTFNYNKRNETFISRFSIDTFQNII